MSQLEEHLTLFRYRDLPGMLGRIGTIFGGHGINIVSAAVGRQPESGDVDPKFAAMVITTDAPVPLDVVEEIASSDGFEAGRTVSL